MKFPIIVFLSLFSATCGFRVSAGHASRMIRRRRHAIQSRKSDFVKKCEYLNWRFPVEPETCPVRGVSDYRLLYSPLYDLRDFQCANCVIDPKDIPVWYVCFIWFLVALFTIGLGMTF